MSAPVATNEELQRRIALLEYHFRDLNLQSSASTANIKKLATVVGALPIQQPSTSAIETAPTPSGPTYTMPNVTGLAAAPTTKDDFQLKWNRIAKTVGFSNYEVRYALVSAGANWDTANTLGTTVDNKLPVVDASVQGDNNYWVAAMDLNDDYGPNPNLSVIAWTTPSPLDPTNLVASASSKCDLKFTWDAPVDGLPHGSEYELRQDLGSSVFATATVIARTSGTVVSTGVVEYIWTDPTPGGPYNYWVAVVNGSDQYDPVPAMTATSYTVPYPPAVTGLTYEIVSAKDLKVKWTAIAPASLPPKSQYAVWINSSNSWATASATAPHLVGTPFIDFTTSPTNYPAGTYYVWAAVKDDKNYYTLDYNPGDATAPTPIPVIIPGPNDPYNFTSSFPHNGTIQFNWHQPLAGLATSDIYQIWTGTSSTFSVGSCTWVEDCGRKTSHAIPKPTLGYYYWFVVTKDKLGNYDPYPPYLYIDITGPADVTSLAAVLKPHKVVHITWTPPTQPVLGFLHFDVRYSTSNVGWSSAPAWKVTKQAQIDFSDQAPSTTYYFWVAVIDMAENVSPSPEEVSGSSDTGFLLDVTQYIGAFPVNLAASGTTSVVTVTADVVSLINASGQITNIQNASATVTYGDSGAGGGDGIAWSSGVSYMIDFIYNPTTSTLSAIATANTGSPSLPSGYTYWRRVSIVTIASGGGAFLPFTQSGALWMYDNPSLQTSTLETGWTLIYSLFATSLVVSKTLCYIDYSGGGGNAVQISTDGSTVWWRQLSNAYTYGSGHVWIPGFQFYYKTGSGGTLGLYIAGVMLNI